MTQGEIEQLTVKTENIFSELEVRIMSDIVRRIKENGVSTASADWQISRLQQLGMSEKQIRTWIQKALEASDKEMNRIFSDEAYREYYGHARAYKLAELQQIPFEQNTFLQQLLEVTKQRLESEYRNIAGSMGFAIRDPATGKIRSAPLMEYYRSTLDNAVMDIHSGAFDYNTVLRRTINQMTASGIRYGNLNKLELYQLDVAEIVNATEFQKPPKILNCKHVTTGGHLVFANDGATLAYLSSSSERYKDVQEDLQCMEQWYNIQPVWAKYKDGYLTEDDAFNGKDMPMFLAEDVEKHMPEAAVYNKDGKIEDWNYRVVIPAMFVMLKKQRLEIEKLKKRLKGV